MFGDLFEEEEDFSFLSSSPNANRKLKCKDSQILEPRGHTRLSGLKNQGGTCYLNSLLQTLLFTPEFREALFALGPKDLGYLEEKEDPDYKVRIIPLQLQRLFAQLLLLDQQAASTTDLTNSFGWNNNEETGQHDVQELNRILFSALESSLEGTSGHNLIKSLYHGTVVNQIKCQECGYISKRQEDFLDLTVAVKDVCSLEESLYNMYVEEEIFEGDNLYRCGSCDKLVAAAKSAKLGKLPPFLTLSLLRFNFDFTKCERYKETSRYTFPTHLNIRPFCEQNHIEDPVCTYELFSVIIHKGGCYGGHYHVYIRDVDELGHWDCQEEVKNLVKDADNEYESPAVTLASIIAADGVDKMIQVDQLGQKLLEHTGTSWSKMYRKQHGSIRKFLQNHRQIFQLSSDGSLVGLAQSGNDTEDSDLHLSNQSTPDIMKNPEKDASHWFDFNDSTVQSIQEKDIEKQFQGKESAYMLFYRKSQLQRPQEAIGNAHFGVPDYLLQEMDLANKELQKKRLESDTETNRMELHLHLSSCYQFNNGALHPAVSHSDSILEITVDQRRTVGDLKKIVFELLDNALEGQVLSIAKALPAGLHVFQNLNDDEMDLMKAGVKDGTDIFVWDGEQVGGVFVQAGEDYAPLLLTILRKTQHDTSENQCVFSSNSRLSDVQEKLTGTTNQEPLLCFPSTEHGGGWSICASEDMNKTLKVLGLKDGSSILFLNSDKENELIFATENSLNTDFLQVQDLYHSEDNKKTVSISVSPTTTVSKIRSKAAEMLQLQEKCVDDICLRPLHKNGKLLPPVPENVTVQEAEIKPGSILGLCRGKSPRLNELFLYFIVGNDLKDGQEQEIILEETLTVKESLDLILQQAGLSAETGWHLRKMDWCYEAGDPLTDEESTLKELNICTGDTLVITEGRLPPKGFMKLQVWLYHPHAQQDPINHVTSHLAALQASPSGDSQLEDIAKSDFCFVGNIEISGENFLQDLKMQIMTLPIFEAFGIPSPEFLRIWTLENKHLVKILRSPNLRISDYNLGNRTILCVETLQDEEFLGTHDLLLRVQLSVPGELRYFPPVDIAWDISHGCTAHALRQRIANHCSLPVDKVEIAKYLTEKHEWLPISSWTQQVSKKRKKKKPENLQGAPYHLKDGDTIGVKNLLLDNRMDFISENDHIAKEKHKQVLNEKINSEKGETLQNDKHICKQKVRPKARKAESALSIRVGVFR
ncbi:ubiquitin carboxyl-terminal hydrolase 40 [Pelobates cultripes]|uniref:Ubiquitin carboxyl-terminal hydrolase 40 n=2 Tax=Pelobates cultripes TaxID=61616 RepID=A0AAD1WHJ5_PELCU|nr:ubiquitin carboxyl-terminal hydrolase 40 [Pelobates cultripes]